MAYIPYNKSRSDDIKFVIQLYETESGDIPVDNFIKSLEIKIRTKTFAMLKLLEEFGNSLREPYSKPIKNGVFELRCRVGSNFVRILYFVSDDKK